MTPPQVTAQAPAAPPAPPAAPAAPAAAPDVAGAPAIAQTPVGSVMIPPGGFTQEFVNALNRRKTQLSDQLESAQGRRDDVAKDLRSARSETERTGLEKRLEVLDNRLAQLETDIAANGQMLAAAPASLLARASTATAPARTDDGAGPFSSGQLTAISIVFTLFVMAPLAMATARTMLKRFAQPKPAPQLLESSARLERMEQAVDAIAVEVERISEGQRFVTGLMAKRGEVPALATQSADPL